MPPGISPISDSCWFFLSFFWTSRTRVPQWVSMDTAARARLDRWMESLLAGANQLLDLPENRAVLSGDPNALIAQLASGARIAVPDSSALGHVRRHVKDGLAQAEHLSWMTAGALTWLDRQGREHTSPLVLWPVTLDGNKVVAASDQIPRLNDVLVERLRVDHGVTLGDGTIEVEAVLAAAGESARDRSGWNVSRQVSVAVYSFADFDLWRDLVTRGDELSAPLAWVLGMETAPTGFDHPIGVEAALPLDADARQSAAIHAAAAGNSFILQGPPGTGKTQSIANIAAHCTSLGMSVLVVGDRKPALDAVARRLEDSGLSDVCSFAGERSLKSSRPRSFAGRATSAVELAEVTAALDDHVRALHGPTSLGLTVHEVVARLVELRTTANAALAEPDAADLDHSTFVRRRSAVAELANSALAVQPVTAHPWQASELATATPELVPSAIRSRVAQALETAAETTTALADTLAEVSQQLPALAFRTPAEIRALGELAEVAAVSPRPGAELFSASRGRGDDIGEQVALIRVRGGGEIDVPRDPASFMAVATRHRALVSEIGEQLSLDAAEFLDPSELWSQLKKWTTSVKPLRFVALRRVRAQMRAAALPMQLSSDEAMIEVLEAMIAERACREALEQAAEPAQRWFGELWSHVHTLDLEELEAAIAWAGDLRRVFERVAVTDGEAGRQAAWRALIAEVVSPTTTTTLFSRLADSYSRWVPAIAELAAATGIRLDMLGAGPDHLPALRAQIETLDGALDQLADWTRYCLARGNAIEAGIGPAVAAIEHGDLDAAELALAWERATLVSWLTPAVARTPRLAQFDGTRHNAMIARFADLDRGAMAVAPGRLSRLAPCVLATPQAIARCALPMFDLVVIDDASNLSIARSLAALARGRAAVIVGDAKGCRPAGGSDSILDVAIEGQWPVLELSVHYRSYHHDLIAFANHYIHGGGIEVVPAAHPSPTLGVRWMPVVGSAGAGETSNEEARAIVDDIARKFEHGVQSIAVVVASKQQQHRVEDLFEAASLPTGGDLPVLVATPDQLHGEERDLVYVSIGHSAACLAGMAPLDVERWLNVATTRARHQLVVVGDAAPEDGAMVADAGAARLVAELAAFARNGAASVPDESPIDAITEAIGRALGQRGWNVRHRVGVGAGAVALAVLDPDDPQRCALAIEHDGAAYGAARGARDRDRLRDQQLARLGWRIHRIGSLDWWNHPEREVQRAHAAIITAVAAGRQRGPVAAAAAPSRRRLGHGSGPVAAAIADAEANVALGSGPTVATEVIGDHTPVRIPRGAIAIGPYTAAAIPCGRRLPDDMFAGKHSGELAKVVEQVLAAEAPIHLDLLSRRAAAYFGVGRLTARITEQVRTVLEGRGRFGDEPDIVWRSDQDPLAVPAVRVAGSSAVACRDIVEVPLAEVAAAARIVVERAAGIDQADLVRDCARLLGFARVTERVSSRVALGVQLAAKRELIALEDSRAHISV